MFAAAASAFLPSDPSAASHTRLSLSSGPVRATSCPPSGRGPAGPTPGVRRRGPALPAGSATNGL